MAGPMSVSGPTDSSLWRDWTNPGSHWSESTGHGRLETTLLKLGSRTPPPVSGLRPQNPAGPGPPLLIRKVPARRESALLYF